MQALKAQQFQKILEQIETNNTTLAAFKKQTEVIKAESRIGLMPVNPEVEFNCFWGNPVTIGNRTDLNVTQIFDFPTVYYYRNKIAEGKSMQADLQYAVMRKSLLLQASKTCIDLVYRNALKAELDKRLQNAKSIADAYQTKFEKGDIGILEVNKAKLNLLNFRKEAEINEIERYTLTDELIILNGGNDIILNDSSFDATLLFSTFEDCYSLAESQNLALQMLIQEIEINQRQVQLSKSQWLPKFSIGYRSERNLGTTLQGIGVGISIPLWENAGTVKSARAKSVALQFTAADAKIQFYNTLKSQFNKIKSLQQSIEEHYKILYSVSSNDLLQTALEKGQISLIEYMMEQSIYYETMDKILMAEKECSLLVVEFLSFEL